MCVYDGSTSAPVLSVVVCTAHRPALLRKCVSSLLEQALSSSLFEIIVVNNAPESDQEVREALHPFITHGRVKYVLEPEIGLSAARNTGTACAAGRYVYFIDDDATADAHALQEILNCYEAFPQAACVGGRIELVWEAPIPIWLHPDLHGFLGHLDHGEGTFPIRKDQHVGGGNLSVQKDWLVKCGGFLTNLGRDQKSLLSGEEIELFQRIWAHGGECYYAGRALVWHPAHAARLNKRFFRQRVYWGARSSARIDTLHLPAASVFRRFLGSLVRIPYYALRSFWYRLTGDQSSAFLWNTYFCYAVGYSAEVASIK
jgi:glucosyl-dolichyl phosphate glucuronosyltransferase